MSDYQRTAELHELHEYLSAPHNSHLVREVRYIELLGKEPPWQSSACRLRAGTRYSLFARGKIFWTDYIQQASNQGTSTTIRPNLYGDASFHLWARINGGEIKNLSGDTGTFTADKDGELELGLYMGMWANNKGQLIHANNYAALREEIAVLLVVWQPVEPDTLFHIRHPRRPVPALLALERSRLERAYKPPTGWHYLVETGSNEIFHADENSGSPQICVDANNAQGIIRYPVEIPLTETLRLEWQWRLNEHPSLGPEDRARFHDYVSIGAEFSNGRDLTWIWSKHLNPEHHFHCPVKDWSARETHYVVRTADDPIDRWVQESRLIYADVKRSQGEPPTQVVAIWLIAVSTFSHARLRAAFSHISLKDNVETRVL